MGIGAQTFQTGSNLQCFCPTEVTRCINQAHVCHRRANHKWALMRQISPDGQGHWYRARGNV